MADIKQIVVGNETFDIKDATARAAIASLDKYTEYLGVTSTSLSDGSTTNPIVIDGDSITAKKGDIVNYGSKEFIFNGTAWQEFGDIGAIGAMGYADSGEASYTPAGSISGTVVSASNAQTTSVNSITAVGTLPSLTVANEVLSFNPGTLPTKGDATTVVASIGSLVVTDPSFTGTPATIEVTPSAT